MGFDPFVHAMSLEGEPHAPPLVIFDHFGDGRSFTANNAAVASAQGKFSELANMGDWLVTVTDGGGDNAEVIVTSDAEPGGVVTITTNDADDDSMELQMNGEAFAVNARNDMWFSIRMKLSDADTCDWFVGLATTDTAVLDGTTDSIGFTNTSNSADIRYIQESATTTVSPLVDTTYDFADDTFRTLSFHTRKDKGTAFFVDGNLIEFTGTNLPDAGDALTPTICLQNASAAASSMEVDFIYARMDI